MSSAPLLNICFGLDCFDSCCSGIAVTCWWRSDIDLQAIDTALRVTASDPEVVVGVGLQVSHSQPATCCCTSIQHSISIYEGKAHKMEEKGHQPSTEQGSRTSVVFPRQIYEKMWVWERRILTEINWEWSKSEGFYIEVMQGYATERDQKNTLHTAYPINSDRHTPSLFFY